MDVAFPFSLNTPNQQFSLFYSPVPVFILLGELCSSLSVSLEHNVPLMVVVVGGGDTAAASSPCCHVSARVIKGLLLKHLSVSEVWCQGCSSVRSLDLPLACPKKRKMLPMSCCLLRTSGSLRMHCGIPCWLVVSPRKSHLMHAWQNWRSRYASEKPGAYLEGRVLEIGSVLGWPEHKDP